MPVLTLQKDVKVSKKPYKRSLAELFAQGVVVLDKPAGIKCKHLVWKVKDALEVGHAGHVGTLDPMVTGVLAICLNKATKLTGVLSESDKAYEGIMNLHGEVSDAKLKEAFGKFTGEIEQLPPKISAVKRALRKRTIYFLSILQRKENLVVFRVKCQHGTYIRKLCSDLGDYLGVGAHMWRLKRIESGAFTEKDMVSLAELEENYQKFLETKEEKHVRKVILPIEAAVAHLEKVWIDDEVMKPLKNGSPIFTPGIAQLTDNIKVGDWVAIFNQKNMLCAVGKAEMDSGRIMSTDRGLAIKTDIVLLWHGIQASNSSPS